MLVITAHVPKINEYCIFIHSLSKENIRYILFPSTYPWMSLVSTDGTACL